MCDFLETQNCAEKECLQECEPGPWSEWSECPATCGGAVQTRTRAVNKLPTGVIAMEAGATKDVEGAQADLECAKEKDVKAVSEDAEIASVSTDTPASEAPASDEGSVNEVHSTAPTGKDGTEVGGSRVLA